MENMKIGLALSGGGVRAAVFHLGVLKRLSEQGLLEKVTDISTVSGASLVIGLVFSKNNNCWPTSREFIKSTLPDIKAVLTKKDLQMRSIWTLLSHPWWIRNRAMILAKEIHTYWGIRGKVNMLPEQPRWIINATAFETGKNWRFMNVLMGDYVCGYVLRPDIPLSVAMASSASLPFLIGPYSLRTGRYQWVQYDESMEHRRLSPMRPIKPPFKQIHLWDGGVYENLGVEPLFKNDTLWEGINYLIVSDASAIVANEKRSILQIKNLLRLINIAVEQIRSLRARDIVAFFEDNPNSGLYLKMGNTTEQIIKRSKKPLPIGIKEFLSDAQVDRVKHYKTTLRKMSDADFELILRHGYEVMSTTEACCLAPKGGSGGNIFKMA